MTDWKAQISYNYNPSYHAYAYGLMYQPGSEQNHGNHLSCWSEAGVTDLSNYNPGVTQAYYATTARAREESPPGSPEQHAVSGDHHYQGSGVVYLGDAQTGRLLLSRPHRAAAYDSRDNEVRTVGSDSPSDSEAHTSPDSWSSSSSSSREGSLPRADPATWVKKELDNEARNDRSPMAANDVSSSLHEEPLNFAVLGRQATNDVTPLQHAAVAAPNKLSTTAAGNPKVKMRTAFSESQMNTLVQRFSVQKYLTPAEMKNLGELTGLTYKQVKTWFQNRRMKLRRHQKDTSWVSERYIVNKDGPTHGAIYTNLTSHIPPYRGEAQVQVKEHYNQHMMEAAYKKAAPQNMAYYLSMNNAAGSAGYASWPTASSQTAVHARPQAAGWPMPSVGHYEYNPNAFNVSSANNTEVDNSSTKDKDPVNS